MPKDLKYSRLLDFYSEMLTEKQCEALDYYYNEDLSLSEISENLNISRQGAMDIIHRAQNQLDLLEEKLHLTEISERLELALQNLDELIIGETNIQKKQKLEIIKQLITK